MVDGGAGTNEGTYQRNCLPAPAPRKQLSGAGSAVEQTAASGPTAVGDASSAVGCNRCNSEAQLSPKDPPKILAFVGMYMGGTFISALGEPSEILLCVWEWTYLIRDGISETDFQPRTKPLARYPTA